jgi:glycogen phosphorylase
MYGGTALAFRDRLIMDWNKTQQTHTFADQKRIYCKYELILVKTLGAYSGSDLSLEFLMGRALDNAMLNVGQKDTAKSETS